MLDRLLQAAAVDLMKSGGNASRGEEDADAGGRSGKPPHWRRREQAATTVYVVHPTEFRTVVQQLTGAASPPPLAVSTHQHVGSGVGNGGAGTRTNAVAHVQHQHSGGEQSGSSRGRTLGQMHQDLLAWANADDC